jgi:hypothetical protein
MEYINTSDRTQLEMVSLEELIELDNPAGSNA